MTETTGTTIQERHDQSERARWIALVVLCIGMLMIVLDQTIVNVALPSIQSDLGFTQSGLAWVVNAYLIAFGGLLLLAGRLGDLVGRKRVFMAGLALFTVASLLCGLAVTPWLLIAARFVQGVGGATTSAVILGMIVTMFPRPDERARAIGVYSFVASAGASIGLLGGGVLTEAINWHWIFFVNVPIGLATALLAARLLDVGAGLSFPSLMTLSMSDATAGDSGLASGLANTTLQVGGALGLAVLTTLSTTRTNALLALGDSAASALTGGYHLALAVGVGLVVAAVVITATLLRPRAGDEAPAETAPGAEDCADSKETEPAQA